MATIPGTAGNDNLLGSPYADLIYGFDGNDILNGSGGNDTIDGGSGNDTLIGGIGNDELIGGSGNDRFDLSGNDIGRDTFNGGEGTDRIYVNGDIRVQNFQLTAANVISTEVLNFAYGHEIGGTNGNDVFNISGIQTIDNYKVFELYEGNDSFVGYAGNDIVYGGAGSDTLNGGAGNDTLVGGSGNDTLLGGAGNDTLDGGLGDDIINGGAGVDTAIFAGATNFRVNLGVGTRQNTGQGSDQVLGIENLIGGTGHDAFTGNGLANLLNGQGGNDTLLGLGGNDTLVGGFGNDLMDGGAGVDTILFTGATSGVRVNLNVTTAQATGQGSDIIRGVENLTGSGFNDVFTGNGLANVLIGNAGNDMLAGMGGNDRLDGGFGNDTLDGGAGIDTAIFASAGSVRVNLAQTTAQNTGMGLDVLRGIEHVISGAGADLLRGNALANHLNAGAGKDVLYGGAGNDTLQGGAGDDFLWGEGGNDILTGGIGADRFAFDANNGIDRVTDFQDGIDRIVIRTGAENFNQVNVAYDPANLSNTVLTFGDTKVTLVGVSYWNITASDFEFI